MGKGQLAVYNLGEKGVNVDSSPIHKQDGELLSAQNAEHNKSGVQGGLVNRPGLVKLNSVAGVGTILGGIGVPLGGGSIDKETIYAAMVNGGFWRSTADLFATTTAINGTPIAAWDQGFLTFVKSHIGAFFEHRLYYVGQEVGSQPVIRVFNGVEDYEVLKLLPATAIGISAIWNDHGTLYVLTLDSGTDDTDWIGRVFEFDPTAGHLLQIGPAFPTGHKPATIAVHNGFVFVGSQRATTSNEGAVYRINPLDEVSWTLDDTLPADRYIVSALASFKGLLYSGSQARSPAVAQPSVIRQRSLAGVWSTVDTAAANGGAYDSLVVFGDHLYASGTNYTAANSHVVRRSSDGSTWATVQTSTEVLDVDYGGWLFVVGSRLFLVRVVDSVSTNVYYTLNGTSWTLAPTISGAVAFGGVLGSLSQ